MSVLHSHGDAKNTGRGLYLKERMGRPRNSGSQFHAEQKDEKRVISTLKSFTQSEPRKEFRPETQLSCYNMPVSLALIREPSQ